MVEQYSLVRTGLEVYKTKEEEEEEETQETEKTDEETSEETSTETTEEDTSTEGFKLLNGEIEEIHYYSDLYSNTFEEDYGDINSNGGATFNTVDQMQVYKGKKICLKKAWETPSKPLTWEDLKSVLMGFITEQTYSQGKVELKFSGMSKLLERSAQFEFSQMKRSEIIIAVIEEAELKAEVDPTGLNDEVMDYSNKSSSKSGDDDSGELSSTGSASIDEAVKKAIKGKTDALAKAKAIDQAFKSHIIYSYYYDVHHPDLDEAWKHAHLNCADGANVLCAMFTSAGLKAVIVHVPNHYIVKLSIGGKTYYTDNAASSGAHTTRPFGQTWKGMTSGSEVGTKIGG